MNDLAVVDFKQFPVTILPYSSDQEFDEDVRQINSNTIDTYIRLRRVYESRLWEARGYNSWEAVCEDHFRYTPRYINMQLKAATDFFDLVRQVNLLAEGTQVPEIHPLLNKLTETSLRELRDLEMDEKIAVLSQIAAEGNLPTPAEIKRAKEKRGGKESDEVEDIDKFDKATESIRKQFLAIREGELWKAAGYVSYKDCCAAIFKANVLNYDEYGNDLETPDEE